MERYLYKLTVRRERVAESPAIPKGSAQDSATASGLARPFFVGADREMFGVLILDNKNKAIGFEVVSIGSLNASLVHPRETFKAAILANGGAIICVHNHPSGDTTPSKEDCGLTNRLRRGGELLGIPVLDHLILGNGTDYYSFADNGWPPA